MIPGNLRRVLSFAVLVAVLIKCAAAADLPSLDDADLARGPYSHMHTLLEKTIFQIDVATIDIRFGERTRDRLAALARGRSYSEDLADAVTEVVIGADHAVAQIEFERYVSLGRWIKEVRNNLKLAFAAGLIDEESYSRVSHGLPGWFSVIEQRGFREGDRILYRVRPASLRTVVASAAADVLLDVTHQGEGPPRTLLAGYLAPGVELREPLIRSLFEPRASK